jgi:hypothetical protein
VDPIVIGAIVGPLTVAILYAIASGEPPSVSADGKRTIAAYGRVVKGTIAVVVAALLLTAVREYFDRSDDRGVLYLFIVMAATCGPYLLCEGFRTRFEYDDDNLLVTTAFRAPRTFSWTEIVDISYSHWRSTYLLMMRDGTKIAASEYLSGSDALMDFARRWKAHNQKEQ